MNIGKMDSKISIKRSAKGARDAAGSPVITWSVIHSCWARVDYVSGNESLRMERQITTQVAKFYIRFKADITRKDRVNFEGKDWDITNIKPLGRKEGLEITAEQVE